jgi:hypothetical protein
LEISKAKANANKNDVISKYRRRRDRGNERASQRILRLYIQTCTFQQLCGLCCMIGALVSFATDETLPLLPTRVHLLRATSEVCTVMIGSTPLCGLAPCTTAITHRPSSRGTDMCSVEWLGSLKACPCCRPLATLEIALPSPLLALPSGCPLQLAVADVCTCACAQAWAYCSSSRAGGTSAGCQDAC